MKSKIKKLLLLGALASIALTNLSPCNWAGELPMSTDAANLKVSPWIPLLLLDDPYDSGTGSSHATCLLPDQQSGGAIVTAVDFFSELENFSQPTKVLQAPGDDTRWFVLEKGGRIKVFDNTPLAATAARSRSASAKQLVGKPAAEKHANDP